MRRKSVLIAAVAVVFLVGQWLLVLSLPPEANAQSRLSLSGLDARIQALEQISPLVSHSSAATTLPAGTWVAVQLGDEVTPVGTFRSATDDVLFSLSGAYVATLFSEGQLDGWRPRLDGGIPFTVDQSVGDIRGAYTFRATAGVTTLGFEIRAPSTADRGALIRIVRVGP